MVRIEANKESNQLNVWQGKNKTTLDTLGFFDIVCVGNHRENNPQNLIYVSKTLFETLSSQSLLASRLDDKPILGAREMVMKFIAINSLSGQFLDCYIAVNDKLKDNKVQCNKYIFKILEIDEGVLGQGGVPLMLTQLRQAMATRFFLQNIDSIKQKYVYISKELYSKVIDSNVHLYSFYNNLTGASLMIPLEKIKVGDTLKGDSVSMARFQRELLDLEPCECYEDRVFNALLRLGATDGAFMDSINRNYVTDARSGNVGVLLPDCSYADKSEFKDHLARLGLYGITIKPELDYVNKRKRHGALEMVTRFIVGKSVTTLKCIRPYSEDESIEIVRLSKDAMTILGVDEMDKVKITHGVKTIKCKAVAFESSDKRLKRTNKHPNIDVSVGISADLRKRLGICDLCSTVKVERDTNFLFIKNIQRSLISMLLSIYGVVKIFPLELKYALIACFCVIPIGIYAMFTDIRLKV